MRLPAVLVLSALLAACGSPLFGDTLARDEVREGDFALAIESPRHVWPADEPISVMATLTYDGPLAQQPLFGSGSGLVGFSVVELDGTRRMDAAWRGDCAGYAIAPGHPIEVSYTRSGGWTADDPNAAFYSAFFDDPAFRLPPGRWEVAAATGFSTGEGCAADVVSLTASIVLDVR